MLAHSSKVHVSIWCGVARGCKVWLGVGLLVYSGHSRCPGSDYRVQHPGCVSDWLTSYQRVKSPSLSPKIQDWRWVHGPGLWETQSFGWLKKEREKTTRKKHFIKVFYIWKSCTSSFMICIADSIITFKSHLVYNLWQKLQGDLICFFSANLDPCTKGAFCWTPGMITM